MDGRVSQDFRPELKALGWGCSFASKRMMVGATFTEAIGWWRWQRDEISDKFRWLQGKRVEGFWNNYFLVPRIAN